MPGKTPKNPISSQAAHRQNVGPHNPPSSTSCSWARTGDPNQLIAMSTALGPPAYRPIEYCHRRSSLLRAAHTHRNTPLAQAYTSPTTRITRKIPISHSAKAPSPA